VQRSKFLLSGLLALGVCGPAPAEDKIAVVVPATLDPNAAIGENIRRECAIEAGIGNEAFANVSKRYPGIEPIRDLNQAAPGARVVRMTIVGALGAGGGAWSGPKSITIRADLIQNTKVLATKILRRQSNGGAFGGFKGTCSIMERITVALGRDVAAWLPRALATAETMATSAGTSTATKDTATSDDK